LCAHEKILQKDVAAQLKAHINAPMSFTTSDTKSATPKVGRCAIGRRGKPTNLYLPTSIVLAVREKFKRKQMTVSQAVTEFLRWEFAHEASLLDCDFSSRTPTSSASATAKPLSAGHGARRTNSVRID
jgi:hypothetical protein